MFYFPSFLTFTTQTLSYFVLNPYGWQFRKIWTADKKSFSLTKSVLHATFRWQICHRNCLFYMKKAAMISSSLLLKISVPYRNRTYNRVLGGPRYIHLTKGTNAVFSGFFSLLATVAISMNPITFVMNFYCNLLWHPGQSLLESNSDLSLLNFRRCQPWLNLRRLLLYPFNYENNVLINNTLTIISKNIYISINKYYFY